MSTKLKRKPRAKGPPKEKRKPARRRKAPEEKKVVPARGIEKAEAGVPEKPFLLAVRLLGPVAVPTRVEDALTSLRLGRKFRAVLLEKNNSTLGVLRKVKDFITWGEVKSHDIAVILKERGELSNGMTLTDKFVKENLEHESIEDVAIALTKDQIKLKSLWEKGIVPVFRLHPPSGGFESSIKRPFGSYGELGYRGVTITELVTRML
jgi:large subunit ribosomal protein L30